MRKTFVRSVLLTGLMFSVGCSGAMSANVIPAGNAALVSYSAQPVISESLPSLYSASTRAHGLAWAGYNMGTQSIGFLDDFSAGSGAAFGLGFGDGLSTKSFIEVAHQVTEEHKTSDAVTPASAVHKIYMLGKRTYTAVNATNEISAAAKLSPYYSYGFTFHTFDADAIDPDVGFENASGMGMYFGLGLEYPIGSGTFSLCCDFKSTATAFTGYPTDSGISMGFGSTIFILSHF